VSAESGVKTFRDNNGLWENHRMEDVATPEAFFSNPELVHKFYNARRAQLKDVEPNAAHKALVELEKNWAGDFLLITQNVDDLHDRAGSEKLLHMHGELKKIRCVKCSFNSHWEEDLFQNTQCPSCESTHGLRPDIVWFGEMPFGLDECFAACAKADIFISIGTSGEVYPAAGFVSHTPELCRRIEVNPKSTGISRQFDEHIQGPAAEVLPDFLKDFY
jgi:NAD-dependent deacetylase